MIAHIFTQSAFIDRCHHQLCRSLASSSHFSPSLSYYVFIFSLLLFGQIIASFSYLVNSIRWCGISFPRPSDRGLRWYRRNEVEDKWSSKVMGQTGPLFPYLVFFLSPLVVAYQLANELCWKRVSSSSSSLGERRRNADFFLLYPFVICSLSLSLSLFILSLVRE